MRISQILDFLKIMNREEQQKLISQLRTFDSYLPPEIFYALSSLMVTTAIELILIKKVDTATSILLVRRDIQDPYYANKWHVPGSILRKNDASYEQAITRIAHDELKIKFQLKPKLIGNDYQPHADRGPINSLIFLATPNKTPIVGTYFDVKKLPPNIVKHQLPLIQKTVQYYLD